MDLSYFLMVLPCFCRFIRVFGCFPMGSEWFTMVLQCFAMIVVVLPWFGGFNHGFQQGIIAIVSVDFAMVVVV